ncbi:Ig-like domain-containing protein [Methanobrevibacter sp.]|uniref:Ig-like domain-containing protein n=1 Tax=Methanobrevibacter sp. TaxID=66852 RepID=UPI00388D80C1
MNKNIIIAILVVIIIAAGAAFMFGQIGKTKTEIKIINNETFQNGEAVQFELKDDKGNAIAGQTLNITYNNGTEKYSVTTDDKGKGHLMISGEKAGKYEIEISYAGNDKYAPSTAKDVITITDDLADNLAKKTPGKSVASTNDYNNKPKNNNTDQNLNNTPDNPFPGDPGTYFIPQLELWVRSSDNVVIDAPNGKGIGLTVTEWIATYGPGSTNSTNHNNSTK